MIQQPENLLQVSDINVSFGGLKALSDVNLSVPPNRVTAVIGPNGAGKTTLFNVISGFYSADSGSIQYEKTDLLTMPAHSRSKIGISRTFQNIALFPGMSVLENIKLGAHAQLKTNVFSAAIYLGSAAKEERAVSERIYDKLLNLLELEDYADRSVSGLPYGIQKRIELARALAAEPKLLMLDEPFAGMNTAEKANMADHMRQIIEQTNITVLLIDHDMESIMSIADSIAVLNFGRLIASGTPSEIQKNPAVIDAYLGEE